MGDASEHDNKVPGFELYERSMLNDLAVSEQQGPNVCLRCMEKEVIVLLSVVSHVMVRNIPDGGENYNGCQCCPSYKKPNKVSFTLMF